MPQTLETVLQVMLAATGAYLAAFWFCLVVWAFRDIQKRTNEVVVQVLATLLVMLFNLPGLLLYVILRPPETLAETYARSLEEEALIQDVQERQACSKCRHEVEDDYLVCPACGTAAKSRCPQCNRLMSLGWEWCAYCGWRQVGGDTGSARVEAGMSYPLKK